MAFVCSVCLDLLSTPVKVQGTDGQDSKIVASECGHVYHDACLNESIIQQLNHIPKCPKCARDIALLQNRIIFFCGDDDAENIDDKLQAAKNTQIELEKKQRDFDQLSVDAQKNDDLIEEKSLYIEILRYEFSQLSIKYKELRVSSQKKANESFEKDKTNVIKDLKHQKSKLTEIAILKDKELREANKENEDLKKQMVQKANNEKEKEGEIENFEKRNLAKWALNEELRQAAHQIVRLQIVANGTVDKNTLGNSGLETKECSTQTCDALEKSIQISQENPIKSDSDDNDIDNVADYGPDFYSGYLPDIDF